MGDDMKEKTWSTTLLLAVFLGHLGIHRFYVGKIATGLIYLLTMGCFGIGYIVDIILIIIGKFTDSDGRVIKHNTSVIVQDNIYKPHNDYEDTINMEKKIKISNANRANPYVDITPYELGITLPFVNYVGFHPMNEEVLLYAAPATTFKDKERVLGYRGKSSGVSVRVAKGVSVRSGTMGSQPIRGNVRQNNSGDLLITNKRVIFVGKDDSFEFQVEKVSTIKLIDKNSFIIQAGRSFKNVWLDTTLVAYAYGLINYAINQSVQGVNVYMSIKEEQSNITQEQLDLCNRVKQECSNIRAPKQKSRYERLWSVAKILWIVVAVVLVVGIIIASVSNNKNVNDVSAEMRFELSDTSSLTEEVFIDEHDTITFYVYPTSVEYDDIELINSDDTKALCLIQDVRYVNGKRLVIVSFRGQETGESTIYLKEKNGNAKSESVRVVVKEKQIEVDNSRTVYLNYGGNKYHFSSSCAGKSAYKSTLNSAKRFYSPCSKCAN